MALPDGALPERTERGRPTRIGLDRRVTENGHHIWTHVAWGELAQGWRQRSEVPLAEVQPRLIRFLTSKNLRKDGRGGVCVDRGGGPGH